MENQKTPSSLEEFLFGFTRLFAIGGALIGLIAVALLIIKLSSPGESTYVALEDIKTTGSTKSNTVAEASAKPSKKLIIPENVKKYTSEKDEKVKQSWLDGIDGQDKKQDFLTNMSQVIADTESKKVDIITVMNSYRTLKLSKLNKSWIDEYKEIGEKAALYSAIFAVVIFIALMSLILVMLAIERNTRNGRKGIGLKLCPKCNSFQDAVKEKCPNCEYDLTNIS